jgi:DNA-binding NarL/FixJ family response regulator
MTITDIAIDSRDGTDFWHLVIEGSISLISMLGGFYLFKGTFNLKRSLKNEKELSLRLSRDSKEWNEKSQKFLQGLSLSIDEQLTKWQLTKSEKEVAFLLLKGFSFREIGEIRGTAEKTARSQSASIYSKSALGNRSQLSAFFLEDLLSPNIT